MIKATQPYERLNLDFKGPLPSASPHRYLLDIVDEYSRFPFAFPSKDVSTPSVIKCLTQLFSIFGLPAYVHSDRGQAFLSKELKDWLHSKGVATSKTTPYNPQGNGQVERYNGVIWKTVNLALRDRQLPVQRWQEVLPDALHSIRTLLCTATNETPHDRFFAFKRRSSAGQSLPSWLMNPGKVLHKRHVRQSKYEPLVEEVDLLEANPNYAHIRNAEGRETTVSLRDLAPRGTDMEPDGTALLHSAVDNLSIADPILPVVENVSTTGNSNLEVPVGTVSDIPVGTVSDVPIGTIPLRRSARERRPVDRLDL